MSEAWVRDYEACVRNGQDIMERITQRNRQQRGSSQFNSLSAHIRTDLWDFSSSLLQLREELKRETRENMITQREVYSRQNMLEKLQTKEQHMQLALKQDPASVDRASLLTPVTDYDDPWGVGAAGRHGAGRSAAGEPDVNNPFVSVDEIRQQQQTMVRQQDEGLDVLSSVINRQKQMALDIGQEVEGQNDLIDDIIDHTDGSNQRLIQETRHIKVVDRKTNTCWMWVVIVLLFVAILVICVVPKPG